MNKAQRLKVFRAYLAAFQLLKLCDNSENQKLNMLDVGGGDGIHARFFRRYNFNVDIVDLRQGDEPLSYEGDYLNYNPVKKYDIIWSSHMLEHVPNVGIVLKKMYDDLIPGGYLAISVPPMREEVMAFVHLSFWNTGLLLLNCCLHGFDPRTAHMAKYGYNVSLIIKKPYNDIKIPVKKYFPQKFLVNDFQFRGNIQRLRWEVNKNYVLNKDKNFYEKVGNKAQIVYKDIDHYEEYRCV